MNTIVILAIVGLVTYLASLPLVFFMGRRSGKAKKKGQIMFLGLRASTKTPYVKWLKPVRGVLEWKERGDFEAHIPMDNGFVWEGPDGKVALVDLDKQQLVRYEGSCRNDDELTVVFANGKHHDISRSQADLYAKRPDVVRILDTAWQRLPGSRLASFRKDTRIKQMNDENDSFWDKLMKVVPLIVIVMAILLVVLLGMVGTMLFRVGGG